MQSRCSIIVARNGRRAQRSVRRDAFSRRQASLNRSRASLLVGYYPGHMRIQRSTFRRQSYHSSSEIVFNLRRLHTSSPLSSQAISTSLRGDDDDDDEYVTRIANSHLSELLRDDMHHSTIEEVNVWSSLDDELGETSIWDSHLKEEEDDDPDMVAERLKNARRQRQAQKRSAYDMLLHFDPQCPPKSDNLEDLELWLECQAQRESVLKYQSVLDNARERRDYSSLSIVQKQILRWYPKLRDAIEEEQKAYITKSKSQKDMNRYGPFLCTLQPQKLAVIVAHESIMHTLRKGLNGITLVSLALEIGSAVEAEVNVQRALRKGLEESSRRGKELGEEGLLLDDDEASEINGAVISKALDEDPDEPSIHFDNWMYGPSHLQRFIEEAHSLDPSKKNRIRLNYANRRARRILNSDEEWTKVDKLKLGVVLIEALLRNATIVQNGKEEDAFSYEKRFLSSDKFVGRVYLHEMLYKMVTEDSWESLEANTTRYKPMILPPRNWVAPDDGGYSWLKGDIMRTHGCKLQKEALYQADLSTVFDGLNVLGRVPWNINKFVLDVAQRCWRENIPLGDIPSRTDLSVPPKPIRPERDPDLEPDSDEFLAANAEFRSFREALTRHYRLNQKNMVRIVVVLACSTNYCILLPPSAQHL